MTNLLLLQAGYLYMPYVSHEKLIEDNKPDYYLTLRTSQKTLGSNREDIVPWLTFFLKIVLAQSHMAVALLSDANFEKTLSPNQRAVWRYLQRVPEAVVRKPTFASTTLVVYAGDSWYNFRRKEISL